MPAHRTAQCGNNHRLVMAPLGLGNDMKLAPELIVDPLVKIVAAASARHGRLPLWPPLLDRDQRDGLPPGAGRALRPRRGLSARPEVPQPGIRLCTDGRPRQPRDFLSATALTGRHRHRQSGDRRHPIRACLCVRARRGSTLDLAGGSRFASTARGLPRFCLPVFPRRQAEPPTRRRRGRGTPHSPLSGDTREPVIHSGEARWQRRRSTTTLTAKFAGIKCSIGRR